MQPSMMQQQGMMMPQQGMMMPQQGMMMPQQVMMMPQQGGMPNMMQPNVMMQQPPPPSMPAPITAVAVDDKKEDSHVPVAAKSTKNWCLIGVGVFLFLLGPGFVSLGINNVKTAELMNPEEDFVEHDCTIDEVDYTYEVLETTTCKRRRTNCSGSESKCCTEWQTKTRCSEAYIYIFFINENPSKDYHTDDYSYQRDDATCLGESEGAHELGEIPCYEPAVDLEELPDGYICPNDECVKIVDPLDDKQNMEDDGSALIIVGFAMTVLGFVLLIMGCCCGIRC